MTTYVLPVLASLIAVLGTCHSVGAFLVEHSFDGSATFTAAGRLEGTVKDKELTLVRNPLSSEQKAALQQLVEADGFYTLRIKSKSGPAVVASIRAACFAQASNKELFSIKADGDGNIVGMTYTTSGPCPASTTLPSDLPLVEQVQVPVVFPAAAPTVQLADAVLDLGGSAAAETYAVGVDSGSNAAASKDQKGPKGKGKPEEEKTWWEKNWLFVMGGTMLVFNVMGKMTGAGQEAQGRPGQAAAGAGAAARR